MGNNCMKMGEGANPEDKKKSAAEPKASEIQPVPNNCDCKTVEEFEVSDRLKFENVSCLGIAVLKKDLESVKALLGKGCPVNFDKSKCLGAQGVTPLMMACDQSTLPIVSLLVKQPGIQLDKITTSNEETALNRAVRRDNNLEMVKLLVEAGAEPDKRCMYGFSPLHQAAKCGQLEVVKYLHSKGADIKTHDNGLSTPLWCAALSGNLEIVKFCASKGAPLDTPSASFGWYPLNAAVVRKNVDVVKFLIEQGADVDKKCEDGFDRNGAQSSLEIARSKMDDLINQIWNAKDTPAYHAYEEIIRLLKEAGAKESSEATS